MNELRKSFERLAGGLQKSLYNTAARLVGNPEDALDLARDTFLRAYTLYVAGLRPGAFRTWIYQVMMDAYLQRACAEDCPRWVPELRPAPFESDSLGQGSPAVSVDGALKNMPEDLRIVYILCDMDDFSYHQIAQIMRRPALAIAAQVFQARRMIRTRLQEQVHGRPPVER